MKSGKKNGTAKENGERKGRAGVMEIPELPGAGLAVGYENEPALRVLWMLMASGAYSLRSAVSVDRIAHTMGWPEVGMVLDRIRELRTPLFTAIWRFITEPGTGYTAVVWLETDEDKIREFAERMAAEAEPYQAIAAEMEKRCEARRARDQEGDDGSDLAARATGIRLAADGARDAMRANYRGWVADRRRFDKTDERKTRAGV